MKKKLILSLLALLLGAGLVASVFVYTDYIYCTEGDNAAAFMWVLGPSGALLRLALWGGLVLFFVGLICAAIIAWPKKPNV